jgi:hypothetical protein
MYLDSTRGIIQKMVRIMFHPKGGDAITSDICSVFKTKQGKTIKEVQ